MVLRSLLKLISCFSFTLVDQHCQYLDSKYLVSVQGDSGAGKHVDGLAADLSSKYQVEDHIEGAIADVGYKVADTGQENSLAADAVGG